MIKLITTLSFSMSFIFMWGLFLLDVENPGSLGVILCLIYTLYADTFFKKGLSGYESLMSLLKFVFPVGYLLMAIYKSDFSLLSILLNPIISAFIIFLVGTKLNTIFEKYSLQFFTISYIFLYSMTLHPKWQYLTVNEDEASNQNLSLESENLKVLDSINIFEVPFTKGGDTLFYLPKTGKFLLVETWNEKCPPCIIAINDLKNKFDKFNLFHYYLYEPNIQLSSISDEDVFTFDKIHSKDKILIDKNNILFKKYGLKGNPYFLLFDSDGQLVYQYFGYHTTIRENLIHEIITKIKINQPL